MRTNTHTTKKAVSAKRTRTTRTTKSVKSKATKKATPKSLKGLCGKLKVTQKYVKSIYDDILKIGYCDLQNLLKYESPKYYTAGTYDGDTDVYSFGNLAIVTGYRPFGRHVDKKLVDKYEYKAMKMSEKYKNDKIAKKHFDKLIREFISEALSTTKKTKSLKDLNGRKKSLGSINRAPRVKTMTVAEGKRWNISQYPNFDKTGSIIGMRKYYGKMALMVRCGNYIYNVTTAPEIYEAAR